MAAFCILALWAVMLHICRLGAAVKHRIVYPSAAFLFVSASGLKYLWEHSIMKASVTFVALISILGFSVASAQTADFPKRKAGMWEMKTESAQMPAGMTVVQCIDEATDAEMQKKAMTGNGKSDCKMTSSKKTATGWEYDSVCKSDGTTITGHVVVSGDMHSAYQMDMVSRFDPPMMGQREMRSTMKVKHLGACKAGMKPGDINVNGMTMNMQSGGKGTPKANMSQEDIKKMIEELQKAKQ